MSWANVVAVDNAPLHLFRCWQSHKLLRKSRIISTTDRLGSFPDVAVQSESLPRRSFEFFLPCLSRFFVVYTPTVIPSLISRQTRVLQCNEPRRAILDFQLRRIEIFNCLLSLLL